MLRRNTKDRTNRSNPHPVYSAKTCYVPSPAFLPLRRAEPHLHAGEDSTGMVAAIDLHNPFNPRTEAYTAWHIRTSEGESPQSYAPKRHPYVIREEWGRVCDAFARGLEAARAVCGPERIPYNAAVYLSSNRCAGTGQYILECASLCCVDVYPYGFFSAGVSVQMSVLYALIARV